MSHELTIRRDGKVEMAYLKGTPVWHDLGQEFEADASVDEIRAKAGMDWDCVSVPLSYRINGEEFSITDRVAQCRSDTGAALGIVSSDFRTVQPREAFDFFRDVIQNLGLNITTAGTLFDGRRLWVNAFVGEQSLIDDRDRVRSNLLFSTALDGTMATNVRFVSTCTVCNNTLRIALAEDSASAVRVIHSTKFDEASVKKTLGIAPRTFDEFMQNMRMLGRTPVGPYEAAELTTRLLNKEDKDDGGDPGQIHKRITEIFAADMIGGELEGRSGTAWGWLNSVTQWADHERRALTESHRLSSLMFGKAEKIKDKALRLAMETV